MSTLRSSLSRHQLEPRTPPEAIRREGWRSQGILVVNPETEPGLTWADREQLRQIGERLYGCRRAGVR